MACEIHLEACGIHDHYWDLSPEWETHARAVELDSDVGRLDEAYLETEARYGAETSRFELARRARLEAEA
jgi:hypothetical protein